MKSLYVRILLAIYPASWRRRHGAEMEQLIEDLCGDPGESRLRLSLDIFVRGLVERLTSARTVGVAAGAAIVLIAIFVAGPLAKSLLDSGPGRVIVHRNHTGKVTAVSGAPAAVVLNTNSNKVVSIKKR